MHAMHMFDSVTMSICVLILIVNTCTVYVSLFICVFVCAPCTFVSGLLDDFKLVVVPVTVSHLFKSFREDSQISLLSQDQDDSLSTWIV